MLKLIKGGEVYSPDFIGKKDILLAGDKIVAIEEAIDLAGVEFEYIDAKGKKIMPGFVDGHVHIMGGGGEGGFKTRTPELNLSDAIKAGVTTIVGCIGTDGITRNMEELIAKAKGLKEEGISCYVYSGSYELPVMTLTENIKKDLMMIDEIIGAGEIAISDHRSSEKNISFLKELAADIRVGGMLSGKNGVINIHVGDSERMITPIYNILETTDIPKKHFLPTHMNRNKKLFYEGIKYAKSGGFIDFTTSTVPAFVEYGEVVAAEALYISLKEGVNLKNITFTSDGQGSMPDFDLNGKLIGLKIGRLSSLYSSVIEAYKKYNVAIGDGLKVITSNPSEILGLKNKGYIKMGYDSDIVMTNELFEITDVIAKGKIMMKDKVLLKKGTFEE